MPNGRFNTEPLTTRPAGAEWKAFKRAALAGEYGPDLAPRGIDRFGYGLLLASFIVGLPAIPVGLLVMDGVTLLSVSMSALWVASIFLAAMISLWVRRLDHWTPKTRERFRSTQFARTNGLIYEPSPDVARSVARFFYSASPRREHLDRLILPEFGGAQVANYREQRDWDSAESYWLEAGYIMVPLRRSFPHFFATNSASSGPRGLRHLEPLYGTDGYRTWCAKPDYPPLVTLLRESQILEHASRLSRSVEVEIFDDQLLLVHRGAFLRLASPRLWERIETIVNALSPFSAEGVSRHVDATTN